METKIKTKNPKHTEEFKQKRAAYNKIYYAKTKCSLKCYHARSVEINAKKKLNKYRCECGSFIRKTSKTPHQNSKKHLAFIESKKNVEQV